MRPFLISADYIDWAHGPGAESGYPLAIELCRLADRPNARGQAEIPARRRDLIAEVASRFLSSAGRRS